MSESRPLGFQTWFLRVRTVAIKVSEKWFNFGTAAVLLEYHAEGVKRIQLRSEVSLVESCHEVTEPLGTESLGMQLANWQSIVGAEQKFEFQDLAYLHREYSDPKTHEWPTWRAQPHEKLTTNYSYPAPSGPFLSIKDQVFGQDIPRLAAQYLGSDRWMSSQTVTNQYEIIIPDHRARIRQLRTQARELIVTIERHTSAPLCLCTAGASGSSEEFSRVIELTSETGSVELPFAPQRLDVWVALGDGYALDHYHESPQRTSWGAEQSLFNVPPRKTAELLPIAQALAGGESEVLEFKPYIRFKSRDAKSDELLEAASAFSNTTGGDIYIGVNDYGEPQGVQRDLASHYGEKCRDSETCLRESYERDLKKAIVEGLTPAIKPEFKWHDIAHRLILQVRIPKSSVLVSLLTNGEVFRRVGATNRKLRPSDFVSEKQPR